MIIRTSGRIGVIMDVAGGAHGGAARWRFELDGYLASTRAEVAIIGREQHLTPRWLVRRERLARSADLAIAANNVSFATGAGERVVLLRNALHFLHDSEAHLLTGLPASFRVQIPIVRKLARRADTLVVPSSAMAERVLHHVPGTAARLAIRHHPVTPVGERLDTEVVFFLVPIVPGSYKNLIPQLRMLTAAADRLNHPARIRVTAEDAQLPPDLLAHPRVEPIGLVTHTSLTTLWRTAAAAFYPSVVESFGYPLAEARVYGVPIIAPDTAQAREIAGAALRGYDTDSVETLCAAVDATRQPPASDPHAFARDPYFAWLLRRPVPTTSRPPSTSRPPIRSRPPTTSRPDTHITSGSA